MRKYALLAALSIAWAATASAGDSCQLKRIAVIPFETNASAHPFIPVALNGHQTKQMLDTGAFWSSVNADLAKELNLPVRAATGFYMIDAAGHRIDKMTTVKEFRLGGIPFQGEVELFVDDGPSTLGRNLFTQMDLEIDNAGKTISLFTQDHCKGAGVYWTDEALTLNFKKFRPDKVTGSNIRQKYSEHQIDTPIVAAELEGETVSVLFDTGATMSGMDIEHAKRRFGIGPGSPGVSPAGKVYTGSGETVDTYQYTFKSLTISGLKFENVPILLGKFDDSAHVVLGMHEMKHLRLYFAFKDGMIHITAADAGRTQQ